VAVLARPDLRVTFCSQLTELAEHASARLAQLGVTRGYFSLVLKALEADLEAIRVEFLVVSFSVLFHLLAFLAFLRAVRSSHGFEDSPTLSTILSV